MYRAWNRRGKKREDWNGRSRDSAAFHSSDGKRLIMREPSSIGDYIIPDPEDRQSGSDLETRSTGTRRRTLNNDRKAIREQRYFNDRLGARN